MNNAPKDEYYCTNVDEKEYLLSKGIKYTFVKSILDGKKTTVWKFYKNTKLFESLIDYYNN